MCFALIKPKEIFLPTKENILLMNELSPSNVVSLSRDNARTEIPKLASLKGPFLYKPIHLPFNYIFLGRPKNMISIFNRFDICLFRFIDKKQTYFYNFQILWGHLLTTFIKHSPLCDLFNI